MENDGASAAPVAPNQTLYIRNINEKIKKDGTRLFLERFPDIHRWKLRADLKKTLYAMFSQHGAVVDVVALKTVKMRGQAFIVYKDISSATNALRSLQGFTLFEKPMELQYAKGKSYAIAKEDGTYDEVKRKHQEAKSASLDFILDSVPYVLRFFCFSQQQAQGELKEQRAQGQASEG